MVLHIILNDKFAAALERLYNPEQSATCQIIEGKCPSSRDVEIGLIPPTGVHKDSVPLRFTIEVMFGIREEVAFMPCFFYDDDQEITVAGFRRHTFLDEIAERFEEHGVSKEEVFAGINPENAWMAATFSQRTRKGVVRMSLEMHILLCQLHADEIDRRTRSKLAKQTS